MRVLGLLLGLSMLAAPRLALACASCACGDPTLTVMGTGKPFSGRLRLGLEARLRWVDSGVRGVDRLELSEQRWAVEAAWAPLEWLFVSARLPLVRRELQAADFSHLTLFGLGDAEISTKAFVLRDRAFDARHLIGVELGTELPTSPARAEVGGRRLGFESQLGSGSIDPFAGVSWSWFSRPISTYASVRGLLPTRGHFGARAGPALLASLVAQTEAGTWAAVRLGADLRVEAPFEEGGVEDPHSGGTALFLTPELLLRLGEDWLLRASASFPTWLELRGSQDEGPTLRLGVVVDV